MALAPTAFLIHQDSLHFTESLNHPVGDLLESIWHKDPQFARSITRNRIFYWKSPTPLCQGMLKVVGKRASQMDQESFNQLFNNSMTSMKLVNHEPIQFFVDSPIPLPSIPISLKVAMDLARELKHFSKAGIAAILLGPDQKILSWGWNNHFENRVIHAEIMAIKNHQFRFQKPIPAGSTLITTLQPCAMCAGYLHDYSEKFELNTIVFEEEDPGPFAQNSILIAGSDLHQKSGSIKIPAIKKF